MNFKTSINMWNILYKEGSVELSTMFNSGMIDDVEIIKSYFMKNNPKVQKVIVIKK